MSNNSYEVKIRGGFSDRNGLIAMNKELQIDSLDSRTRTALFNCFSRLFQLLRQELLRRSGSTYERDGKINNMWSNLLANAYNMPVDFTLRHNDAKMMTKVQDTFELGSFESVMDLTEYLTNAFNQLYRNKIIVDSVNEVLEREYVGFRFLNGILVPITNEQEIDSITKATENGNREVAEHFQKALTFLSDRDKPDYANSIKESMMAVEKKCSQACGNKSVLNEALKQLEKNGCVIHPALRDAFIKLYGYTSDENGIRHDCGLGENNSTFAEAEYMLVACSAFVNYITTIQSKQS